MKLGLSSYTFTWAVGVAGSLPARPMTLPELFERARAMGVGLVQVADNLPLDRLSAAELESALRLAAGWGIQVEVGTRGIDPQHLRAYLALAKRFASPILRVVIDTAAHHPSLEEAAAILRPLQPEFEAAGILLAVENHDRFQAGALAGMVRSLGSWAGICLDTVNSFGALEGPKAVVKALGPLAVNLHIKDFTIFRARHMLGFTVEGRPAGAGRLDIPWLLQMLKSYGRDCSAILELWTPPQESLEASIATEQRWAEESVAYLRGLIPG